MDLKSNAVADSDGIGGIDDGDGLVGERELSWF